jgi:hypothetical protein
MPDDDTQAESIAIDALTPLVARLLGWCGSALASGSGISLSVPGDAPAKIAGVIVGIIFVIVHEVMAQRSQKATAQTGFIQGAASAGVTLTRDELPPVKSAGAATPVSSVAQRVSATPPLKPTVDASGNVTITPASPTDYK